MEEQRELVPSVSRHTLKRKKVEHGAELAFSICPEFNNPHLSLLFLRDKSVLRKNSF